MVFLPFCQHIFLNIYDVYSHYILCNNAHLHQMAKKGMMYAFSYAQNDKKADNQIKTENIRRFHPGYKKEM